MTDRKLGICVATKPHVDINRLVRCIETCVYNNVDYFILDLIQQKFVYNDAFDTLAKSNVIPIAEKLSFDLTKIYVTWKAFSNYNEKSFNFYKEIYKFDRVYRIFSTILVRKYIFCFNLPKENDDIKLYFENIKTFLFEVQSRYKNIEIFIQNSTNSTVNFNNDAKSIKKLLNFLNENNIKAKCFIDLFSFLTFYGNEIKSAKFLFNSLFKNLTNEEVEGIILSNISKFNQKKCEFAQKGYYDLDFYRDIASNNITKNLDLIIYKTMCNVKNAELFIDFSKLTKDRCIDVKTSYTDYLFYDPRES